MISCRAKIILFHKIDQPYNLFFYAPFRYPSPNVRFRFLHELKLPGLQVKPWPKKNTNTLFEFAYRSTINFYQQTLTFSLSSTGRVIYFRIQPGAYAKNVISTTLAGKRSTDNGNLDAVLCQLSYEGQMPLLPWAYKSSNRCITRLRKDFFAKFVGEHVMVKATQNS